MLYIPQPAMRAQFRFFSVGATLLKKTVKEAVKPSTLTKPPKPINSYSLFVKQTYPKFKAQYPEEKLTEITKRVVKEWDALGEQGKETFRKQAQPYLDVYRQKKEEYEAKRPKKALTGYNVFVRENYPVLKAKETSLTANELFAALAKQWRSLSDQEKASFNQ